jgi:hypothetical protein
MRSRKTWRAGLLVMLVAGLLTASELMGAPRVTIQSPTALYLLAQYKLVVGDTSSGLELLNRALAGRDPLPARADALSACNLALRVPAP